MLTEGLKAPTFTGLDQDNNKISLSDFKGKKLVLFFYPEDDTPTCTEQACNLRDNYTMLKQNGFEVVGVSPDAGSKHQKFQAKYQLPFTLIADPEMKIINKYGVWGEKNMYGRKYMGIIRNTFLINEKGKIQAIIRKPKVRNHAEEIIRRFAQGTA